MIKFTVGGKSIRPEKIGEALMQSMVEEVANAMRQRLEAVRLPATGEFPTVVVHGDRLDNLSFSVEGSPELLALVKQRFAAEELENMMLASTVGTSSPRAFLSYAWEDRQLAEQLASALQANGIDTWWAGWCIGAGDSLRQKIDEGLADCTHFLVLLTPASIAKPWVNQEMDAGLIRKLNENTRFIAVRSGLAANALPPLLAGMLSPSIDDFDADVRQLVNDIHGVLRKPPLGMPPLSGVAVPTGYSPAATAVAKVFVEASETAMFGDPQRTVQELATQTVLSEDDVRDALHEIQSYFTVSFDRALPKDELFVVFDKHFKEWDPADDALVLARDIVSDESFPGNTAEIGKRYDWPPRRLNPAVAYLINRNLVMDSKALGTHPWITAWVQKKVDATRRFVKSRS
ncbi:MAG: toll/interleukin-1 receptor domain-containing protein [Afipia felis]|nr:toll/interleukin-1 receptor domain-containing protein [Afipia felis]